MSLATHCDSYYAASLNDQTEYPRLQGEVNADICIIGAGFTGLSSALKLAEKGYSVALLEENTIGWGASGRNGGQLIRGMTGDNTLRKRYGPSIEDFITRMCWRGNEIVEENIRKYNIDCDLKHGYVDCAFKPRQMRELEETHRYFSDMGLGDRFRLLSAEELKEHIRTDAYIGGLYNNRDAHLHPLNLARGEARAAASLGVSVFEGSPVQRIKHGPAPEVHTAEGFVRAKMVIMAGNAYHLLEQKKLGGILFPAGTYVIATEPLGEEGGKNTIPSDVCACDINEMLDYYRLSADGRMLYGGRCNYSNRDPEDIKASILPRMLRIFPQLKGTRIDFEWGGKIGVVINRVPQLGRVGDNVYYAQGYSGHGINQTHIIGEILSEAISGQMEHFDVFAKVGHWRIPAPRWVGNQMVALGMLYYRIKDLL